jgi:carboxypeptidase C (cathepsin A)
MNSSPFKRSSLYFLLAVFLLVGLTAVAIAEPTQQRGERRDSALVQGGQTPAEAGQPAPKEYAKLPEENVSVTNHVITLGGKPLPYTAVAGTLLLKADDGRPRANVYFTAYFRDDVKDKAQRPMAFIFNGGPGSASVWLHMGAFGPRKVLLAEDGNALPGSPGRLVDNEYTLLDATDLCFIDPVSTGYSRPVPGESASQFHGYTEDVAAVGDFIRLFVTRYERWASPKFIIGESYGTPRAAGLSGYLQGGSVGMYVNGIVLISAILNFGTARFAPMNDLPNVLFLPTYTADAWYHKKLPADLLAKDLAAVLEESRAFALQEYALALLKGNTLDPAAKEAVIKKIARYTGLSPEFIGNANLRISLGRFTKELLRGERHTIGRLDGRFKGFDLDAAGESYEFDPSSTAISGPFPAALNSYLRTELKYKNDTPYAISGNVRPWSYNNVQNQYLNTAETLRGAMAANQFLKVFVANGYYDGATPFFATEYTFFQTDLGGDLKGRVKFGYYEAGHMMYIHKPSHAKLKADLAEFIKDASGVK